MKLNRSWKVGSGKIKRWRIPIYGNFLYKFIPQPRFLRRWYFKKSFQWWGHPSNHHWKCWTIHTPHKPLEDKERDLWTGFYKYGNFEKLN